MLDYGSHASALRLEALKPCILQVSVNSGAMTPSESGAPVRMIPRKIRISEDRKGEWNHHRSCVGEPEFLFRALVFWAHVGESGT